MTAYWLAVPVRTMVDFAEPPFSKKWDERMAEAEDRARLLLLEHLDERQREEYLKEGTFLVTVKDRDRDTLGRLIGLRRKRKGGTRTWRLGGSRQFVRLLGHTGDPPRYFCSRGGRSCRDRCRPGEFGIYPGHGWLHVLPVADCILTHKLLLSSPGGEKKLVKMACGPT